MAGLFPDEASALRLVSAVAMEISGEWETNRKYLSMDPDSGPRRWAGEFDRITVAQPLIDGPCTPAGGARYFPGDASFVQEAPLDW